MNRCLSPRDTQKLAKDHQTIARQKQLIADTQLMLQRSRDLIKETRELIHGKNLGGHHLIRSEAGDWYAHNVEELTPMAGRVGPVLSVLIPPPLNLAPAHCVTGGYGFTLHKDIVSGGGTPSMTLIYETREEAAEARELVEG